MSCLTLLKVGRLHTQALRLSLPAVSAVHPHALRFRSLPVYPCEHLWGLQRLFCSSAASQSDICVEYKHGYPVLVVPLPSRRERCRFTLRPMLTSVSDFIRDLQREDPGITHASILTTDGEHVSGSTLLDTLLTRDFQLQLNGVIHSVCVPVRERLSTERWTQIEDIKTLVHSLQAAVNLPLHHVCKEKELLQKLELIKQELQPLEEEKAAVMRSAELSSSRLLWAGLALLSVQGGALAWLTWWVYSWDIMEPVTYFLTYSTSISVFAYYVLTKQDYIYPDVKDRQFLHYFHNTAKSKRFNVEQYNRLRDQLSQVEEDLRRLRGPVQLQLPLEQIHTK